MTEVASRDVVGNSLDLSGAWSVQLKDATASPVELPGSLQTQGLGDDVDEHTRWVGKLQDTSWLPNASIQQDGSFKVAGWLQPKKHYVGPARYRRSVTIPDSWAGKQALITFERVHIATTVWWDEVKIGFENSLSTPHEYLLKDLKPGTHVLTVQVDNSHAASVGANAHCVSDHTQTAWNGIIGTMEMRLVPERRITDIAVFPNVADKSVRVRTYFAGEGEADNLTLRLDVLPPAGADLVKLATTACAAGDYTEITIKLGATITLWDEFNPELYGLSVSLLLDGVVTQTKTTRFGMVEYKVDDQRFLVNDRHTVFRGTLDCAAFPLTGYPSMDLAYWQRIFRVCKAHGLNHVRYHCWFPPEVALQAADEAGVYLQCEHAWTNPTENEEIGVYLHRETERVLRRYGNHPSFAMHAYGNEPGGGEETHRWLHEWVDCSRALDEHRRLYTSAAGWGNTPNSDFYDIMNGMRAYPWSAGLESTINRDAPSFASDYRETTQSEPHMPFVNHEGGQWCVYPDFNEAQKYTGFLQPKNYEIFQQNLVANHMGDLAEDFLMASGRLQTICYKYCIEKLLRSPGCGGYQMLGLNDFPGQGTALVGALDVFWDTKPYTSAEEYRQFGGVTVPLARFPKVVFRQTETPCLAIDIAHYGAAPMADVSVTWAIATPAGEVVTTGLLKQGHIPLGLSSLRDEYRLDLSLLGAPAQYRFVVSIDGTSISNHWDFWLYPDPPAEQVGKVKISRHKAEALRLAQAGETVLLVPEADAINTPEARPPVLGFSTIFWNTVWSSRQAPTTMGILCDPKHPIFSQFPTEYHSNYQWWYLINKASEKPLLLDGQDAAFRPVVRVIDDWFTNYRLGLVVEAAVGKGRLLITPIDICEEQPEQIVLNQFRASVLAYMNSDAFAPATSITEEQLGRMILDVPDGPPEGDVRVSPAGVGIVSADCR